MAMTAIITRGVVGGIEAASRILMPVLFLLIAPLAIYSAAEGHFEAVIHFLFVFDASRMTPHVGLKALGLGFFSIGVDFSIMITYAAYAGPNVNLIQVAVSTIVADTIISFMAGIAVFPLVFFERLDPSDGPGLVFTTLPVAFSRMPFGAIAAASFYALLIIAALGSAILHLELVVAPLRNLLQWRRP